MDLYTDLSTLSTFFSVDYVVYIVQKNGRFVDCDKPQNDGVWWKNAGIFKIGNHLKYTEYSESSS